MSPVAPNPKVLLSTGAILAVGLALIVSADHVNRPLGTMVHIAALPAGKVTETLLLVPSLRRWNAKPFSD